MVLGSLKDRIHRFRYRRELRLFKLLDTHRSGYVTLDEIVNYAKEVPDTTKYKKLPNINLRAGELTRSLVSLYHFDQSYDGRIHFPEFIMLLKYLKELDEAGREGPSCCFCVGRTRSNAPDDGSSFV